jgi:hypothetical protein
LISRILVTNPANRATLHEVLNHPWMLRGHSGPPDPHLVHREALRPDDLDRHVIQGMKGFEFGTEEEIERKLIKILESDNYIRSVQYWERKRNGGLNGSTSALKRIGESFSNTSLAMSFNSSSTKLDAYGQSAPLTPRKSRRFSGLEYYKRKLFSPGASPPASPQSHSPPGSQNHLTGNFGQGIGGESQEPVDPTRGFHPLISMYYLAREKMERDKVYGPGHFASSQLSVFEGGKERGDKEKDRVDKEQYPSIGTTTEDGHVRTPTATTRKDVTPSSTGKPDYSMPLPRLPAPDQSHYSTVSYGDGGAAPSPTAATFGPQPRARDVGLPPNVSQGATPTTPVTPGIGQPQRRVVDPVTPDPQPQTQRLPRAPPPAGTHRRSHSLSQRPTVLTRGWNMFGRGTGVDEQSGASTGTGVMDVPRTAGPDITTFPIPSTVDESTEDRERENENKGREEEEKEAQQQHHQGVGLVAGGATLVRKFGSLLIGRSGGHGSSSGMTEDGRKSASMKRSTSARPSADALKNMMEKEDPDSSAERTPTATINVSHPPSSLQPEQVNGYGAGAKATPMNVSVSQPVGGIHRRAATVLEPKRGHERRSSTGGALIGTSSSAGAATGGRVRRPSTGYSATAHVRPLVDRVFHGHNAQHKESVEPAAFDEHDDEHDDTESGGRAGLDRHEGMDEKDAGTDNEKEYKPVYLKGLFSVATTSSKSPYVIKADIRRVLDRMQVQYREVKTGFECIHSPSIDVASVADSAVNRGGHSQQGSGGEQGHGYSPPSSHRPSIVKKASKLSFGMRSHKGKEKEKEDKAQTQNIDVPQSQAQGRPSGATGLTATPSSGSSSFFNVSSHHTVVGTDTSQQLQMQYLQQPQPQQGNDPSSYSPVSNKSKILPPIPRDFATMTSATGSIAPPRSPSPLPSGEVGRDVFDSIAKNQLSVRFEINVVKVRLELVWIGAVINSVMF